MNGQAFLGFARELATSDAEERRRTSISRAYYAAYHVAIDFVRNCGVVVPKRDVHIKLQWCLQQIGEGASQKELTKAGSKLGDLRTERNKADYDLDEGSIAKPANVLKAVKKAEQVVDTIASYSVGGVSDSMRRQIRDFAQRQGWQLR